MLKYTYLCIPEIHLVLLEHLPADHASMVDNDVEVGPGTELALPVGDGGERGDDEERPLNTHTVDLLQECDGLDGLSQAHLVCQDAVSSDERGKKMLSYIIYRGGIKTRKKTLMHHLILRGACAKICLSPVCSMLHGQGSLAL